MELKFKPDAVRELRDLRGFVISGRGFSELVGSAAVMVVRSI
jgi:hypothetical protein